MPRLLGDTRKGRINYDNGSILRIHMVNFMHYTEQTVRPMPGFNVVIGHNGSGKSALVNAICIGLGGNIDTLQRCDNIATFVKRDCDEARIEIELYNSYGDNSVVGCSITDRGKVGWAINGEKVNKQSVEELVASLNIQTGNMCQFLPQDVVKNFPLMTPQERFLSTVKAVGEGQLVEQFAKLKDFQKVVDDNDNDIATKENTLENLKAKMDAIKSKKMKMDNIEQLRVSKELAEKKLKWVTFENDIKEAKKIKKETDRVKELISDFKNKIEECKTIDAKKGKEMSIINERLSVPEKHLKQTERTLQENPVGQKVAELSHIDSLIKNEEEDRAERAESLVKTKQDIERINREIKHYKSEQEVEKEISKLRAKEMDIENKVQTLVTSKSDIVAKSRSLGLSLKQQQKSLDQLKNAEQQKLNQLLKSNPDCFGAVMFIRKHIDNWRASGRFKKGIYEPAVLTLNLVDLEHAVYIEKEVGGQQLEAFVCEDAKEANDLIQELRQKFKRVSVIHGDMNKLDQFKPGGDRYDKRDSASDLDSFNFVSYVSDMFTGPPAVLVHLFMHTPVFTTAVFSEETQSGIEISEEFPNLRKYYVGKTLNTCKKSKYSNLVSRGEEDISYFRPQRLKVNYDQDQITTVQDQVDSLTQEKGTNDKHIQNIADTVAKNKYELEQVCREISQNSDTKKNKQKLEITLKHKQEQVKEMSRPVSEEDHLEKIAQYRSDKARLTKELVKEMQNLSEIHTKVGLQTAERDMLSLKMFHLEEKYGENSSRLGNLQQEVKDQETALKPADDRLSKWKDRLRISKDEAHSCTSDESKDVSKKPPPNYQLLFDQIEARTVEELEAHIEAQDKELRAESKVLKDQEKTARRYEEMKQGIETLEDELDQLKEGKKAAIRESETISSSGVERLKELIETVNDKFSAYFAELGYSGEVTLSRTDLADYKSYGVAIKVRFRDGEEWSELSKGRQSGGEMSVTTAVYMLALQELTTVPFRCVDEINQGLDERNERRVWDMILSAATEGGGSQYFYLAPKMPYNLQYKPGTVVHVCHASDTINRSISSVVMESGEGRWLKAARNLMNTT